MAASSLIKTHKMRYSRLALKCLQSGNLPPDNNKRDSKDINTEELGPFISRGWSKRETALLPPKAVSDHERDIGPTYPLTSALASWVALAFNNYKPSRAALDLADPFSLEFHKVLEEERCLSTGLHDLNLIELAYQITLEVGVEILLAAKRNGDAAVLEFEYHSSRAARDDHFRPWGKLLTGLECEPPIIAQFPFYLMMCQSFGFESPSSRENYVYSALTGVDWAKGKNKYGDQFRVFEQHARASVPKLDDKISGQDRSFWRVSLAYLMAMNKAENANAHFTAPRCSFIKTDIDPYLLMATRAFDTIGSAYMCSDGAAYLDVPGMDSLLGSAVPNDVMDLHTDILTGETRNLLRLLYPNGQTIDQAIVTMSTVFSGMLCELFRGHRRARFQNREDGRIAATSPPYSFCRARHRRIFEILEAYSAEYEEFWDWTWRICRLAKAQITEAGLGELLIHALTRGIVQAPLPDSVHNGFYDSHFEMMEAPQSLGQVRKSLGVNKKLGDLIGEIYDLWNVQILEPGKKPGWGREFDEKSDALLKQAGELLGKTGSITEDVYRFAVAYGRLSMGLPYAAYHTIDAIIIVNGIVSLK